MNLPTRLLGGALLGLALLAPLARAQAPAAAPPTPPESDSWTLGRTYLQIYGGIDKLWHVQTPATAAIPGLGFNLPLTDNLDLSTGYRYEHAAAGGQFRLNENRFGLDLIGYQKMGYIAPFVSLGARYDWQRNFTQGAGTAYNSLFGDVAAGIEVPVTKEAAIKADIEHDYGFSSPHQNNWNYGISANAWVNSGVGGFVGADWENGYNHAKSGLLFTAGIRISFDSE